MKTERHPRRHIATACRIGGLLLMLAVSGYIFLHDSSVSPETFFVDDTLYSGSIRRAAEKHDLPPELVRSLIRKESRFRADAVGSAGEIGLMQILPSGAVAEWARVHKTTPPAVRELFDVDTNLDIGCWYLSRAVRRWRKYRAGTELALAEYNAGAKNASRWAPKDPGEASVIRRIDYPGTGDYVRDIMRGYRNFLKEKNTR